MNGVVVDLVVEIWIVRVLPMELLRLVCNRPKCTTVVSAQGITDLGRKVDVPVLLAPACVLHEVLLCIATSDPSTRNTKLHEVLLRQLTRHRASGIRESGIGGTLIGRPDEVG
jgi:hypothetical protein